MPRCLHAHVCLLAPSTSRPPPPPLQPSSLQTQFQWIHVSDDRIVLFWSTHTECECSSEPVPMFLITRVIVLHHNSRIRDRPTRDCCTLSQRQNGYSVVPEHPHVGPHGPNRASFFMNPMYSIARTRQCPRKSCSPRQPMAAYMWNGLQPVTSCTLIPNPNPNGIESPVRSETDVQWRGVSPGHNWTRDVSSQLLPGGRTT